MHLQNGDCAKMNSTAKNLRRISGKIAAFIIIVIMASVTCACDIGHGEQSGSGRRIVRIGHNQATDHPINIGLAEFEKYVEERLGDRFDIEIFPNELLGAQTDMVQLTQTGAIDFCVASNSILETFSDRYTLFNLPYLFASTSSYHAAMDDEDITSGIFASTKKAGFEAVTWIDAGTRNFYTVNKEINSPSDLKGLKIRVQQSPTNVEMMKLLGGSATPMGFGDVYTALQAHVIDGAENNELALTSNGHGDVCKYYSYDRHQMIPDILIGNCEFIESLTEEERAVFDEGFELFNRIEREEWNHAVEASRERAQEEQGVTFLYPDTELFRQICLPMHENFLKEHEELRDIYNVIQMLNEEVE